MTDDYIDCYNLDARLARKEHEIANDKTLSERNREIILSYVRACRLGKAIRKGQKKRIGPGRTLGSIGRLYKLCQWFRKNLDEVTEADMERVILAMEQGRIQSERGKAYSSETKCTIKKFIRKFYKWLLGENRHYPDLVEWIDTSLKEAQVEAVPGKKEGVWKIVELIPNLKRKALIWVLFDSGFRTSEMMNCRIRDLEKREDGIYYITCRYSKTRPRSVALPYSSELLGRWLNQYPDRENREAVLFPVSRAMLYKTVKLYGRRALGINVYPHMLRHTSATHYVTRLDRGNFCKRFGWSYSSDMADRYVDFEKLDSQTIIHIAKHEQFGEIKGQLENQKVANTSMREQIQEMQKQLAESKSRDAFLLKLLGGLMWSGKNGHAIKPLFAP